MTKFLDTNILLNLQEEAFQPNEKFIISSITIKELEQIKTSTYKDGETKWQARQVLRLLSSNEDKYELEVYRSHYDDEIKAFDLPLTEDSKIIMCAREAFIKRNCLDTGIFVTQDLACKKLAECVGLKTEYIETKDTDNYTGYLTVIMDDKELAHFYANLLPDNDNYYELLVNQYLFINHDGQIVDKYKWTTKGYEKVEYHNIESMMFGKLKPYNNDIYQQCAIDSLVSNQLTVLRGKAGTGKAQPNSTLIPTKNGYIKLGDIKVGDKVLDRFGNETTVLATYPQGKMDNYKITFSDGRYAYCNNEHIWSCYTSRGNFKNLTVQEMLNNGLKTAGGDFRYKIPIAEPVEYSEKDFKIDPYVIGAFLGDGCCKEIPLTISSNDEEIVSEIAKLINAKSYEKESNNNYNWIFRLPEEKQYTISSGNLGQTIITRFQTKDLFKNFEKELICLAHEKRIPNIYKYGSIKQRYDLIQGLMDTDGTIDNIEKGRTRFTSTSLNLIQDLQEICWSLGFSASISADNRTDKYTNGVCYNLTLSCPKEIKPNLFRLKRKKDIAIGYSQNNKKSIYSNKLTIYNIEKMPKQEDMTCILVDNDEHLYLTEQFIVTHNTWLALAYLMNLLERGKIDRIIIFCNTVAVRGAAKLGYYPGDKNSKLLDSQIGNLLASKFGDIAEVERMINEGTLVLVPTSDIRGYDTSGMKAGILLTEAQNASVDMMKLMLQRIGEDSVAIFEGDDLAQVDMSEYGGANNGLRRLSQVFRGQDFYGEVTLNNIYRSRIAAVAELM